MSAPDILRVLIADDHEGFRHELCDTLARQPDIQVVGDESNGADAIQRVGEWEKAWEVRRPLPCPLNV